MVICWPRHRILMLPSWALLIALALIWSIQREMIPFTYPAGGARLTIQDLRVLLHSVSPENRLAVYRMLVSERQSPKGFQLNDDGELDPEGDVYLDYVGVVAVEAWIALDQVVLNETDSGISVLAPEIQLLAVVNYDLSFVWREPKRLANDAVPRVLECLREHAVSQARERGILDNAEEAARKWFEALLRPLGRPVAVYFPKRR